MESGDEGECDRLTSNRENKVGFVIIIRIPRPAPIEPKWPWKATKGILRANTHSHTHTRTLTHIYPHTHIPTHIRTHSHTHLRTPTYPRTHMHTCIMNMHISIYSIYSLTDQYYDSKLVYYMIYPHIYHSLPFFQTPVPLSFSLTYTHTRTHTRAHTHTHTPKPCMHMQNMHTSTHSASEQYFES